MRGARSTIEADGTRARPTAPRRRRPARRSPLPTNVVSAAVVKGGHLITGCTFADRCPHVMPVCQSNVPPLFRLDPARVAACFLYREQGAELSSDQLNEVMAGSGNSANPPTPTV